MRSLIITGLLAMLAAMPVAANDTLTALQSSWAEVNYEVAADQREDAFSALAEQARNATKAYPNNAELLIWQGIIVSTLAGEKGGLGALGLAKEARGALEQALKINPDALQGSAHTSIGTLYHKVPGWPIGFGSDKKARQHLEKALKINPDGIDPNYFMAEFLIDEGEYEAAQRHLTRASQAPQRPGREVADAGRRKEIAQLMNIVKEKLGS